MKVRLIKLTKEYYNQLSEMIDEWKNDQDVNHTNHSPWAIFKNDYHNFDYYLENLEHKEPRDGKVPDSVFFLLDEERNILLGAVNIRHYLNEYLLQHSGHIGDGIRPSERGKGYGKKIIELALSECKKLGIDRVLMTCDKSNIASAKSIISNGGVLENETLNEDGVIEQRYWINLDDEKYPIVKIVGKNYCGKYRRIRVACRAIVLNDDKLLISFEEKTGQWMLPGGGLEKGERGSQCVVREVLEETGYIIDPSQCELEIDEYYGDEKYITKYYFGKIVGNSKQHLTLREEEVGMKPIFKSINDAINVFKTHNDYEDIDEMRRGLYLREYTAIITCFNK